jgi:aryl-alcohol dehydrogenase-like predicted oxidoreductase/uncharacterized RmlC-like cupin family protein
MYSQDQMQLEIAEDLCVYRLGYGAMHLTGYGMWGPPENPDNAIRILRRAVDLGVSFIDTADAYGPGDNEQIIKRALHPYPEHLVICTKGGMLRTGPGDWTEGEPYIAPLGRPAYLRQQVELSLRNLGVDRIDVYQLHSIDPLVPLADQLGELALLRDEGKIRHIGISGQPGVTVEQLDQARRITSIAVVENLFNIADQSGQDVLAYAERQGIAYIPWFPLGHGGLLQESGPLAAAARQHGATPAQLALAWLLRRSPVTLPIPGTTSLQHLEQNMKAPEVLLTEGEWASLEEGCLNPVNWPKSLERPGTRAETSSVPRQIATRTAGRPARPSRDSTASGPGDGRAVQLGGLTVLKKPVNAAGQLPPVFELTVPSGFDVGAHCHDRGEELFYVLEGTVDLFAFHPEESGGPWQRWRSAKGEQIVRASAGGMLVVPEGCPHAFANVGTQPARMLFQTSTPGHWEYFLELSEILRAADPAPQTVAELRLHYGITQLSPLRPGTGPLAEGDLR